MEWEHELDHEEPQNAPRELLRAAAVLALELQASGRRTAGCIEAAHAHLHRLGAHPNAADLELLDRAIRGRGGARERLLGTPSPI